MMCYYLLEFFVMEIVLTWSLVLVSAFVMLFAYNFLLGQSATIKLILSIYIAILTTDGLASIVQKFFFDVSPGIQELIGDNDVGVMVALRLVIFLLAVVILVVKSGFRVVVERHKHWGVRMGIHAAFSFLSAVLFLSTILIYLGGYSFIEGMLFAHQVQIYEESLVAQILIDYYQFWFSLPAVAFLILSFCFEAKETNAD